MGNWYETCAVSHLPIRTGDEVVVFPIRKKTHIYNEWQAGSENSKWYAPLSLPFYAYCESENNFEVKNEKELTEYLNRLQNGEEENCDVMFILKENYETILQEMINRDGLYKKVEKMANNVKSEMFENRFFFMPKNRFEYFFWEEAAPLRYLLKNYAKSKDSSLEEKMIHLFLFHTGLDIMRIPWHPGVGRGSQSIEHFLWRKIAEKTIQKEKRVREKWLEENILDESQSEDDITKTYLWYI